jgi:DNA adenine methylase
MLKPFLKWAGGKTQILDEIFKYFPKEIDNYYESFIGGGSVFINLLEKIESKDIKVKKLFLNDKNSYLIDLYKCIKSDVNALIKELEKIKNNFELSKDEKFDKRYKFIIDDDISKNIKKSRQHVYYFYRKQFNKTKIIIEKSALFIFLNKTCFRGLYRESSNGDFNVPYGNYKKPNIYDENELKELSKIFNKYEIEFTNLDFLEHVKDIKIKDFVYFDPPYYPINIKSFTKYQKEDFNTESHKKLKNVCDDLNKKKIKFVHSNSDCEFNNDNYGKYSIIKLKCKRRINSKKPESNENELIIFN